MGIFMVNCDSEYQLEGVIMTKMGKINIMRRTSYLKIGIVFTISIAQDT